MMTTAQKDCFLAVASLKSYTKAAKQLHISQPAVTKHIQTLEREMRVTLLERDGRVVHLTRSGEKFYQMVLRQDVEMNQFLDEARRNEKSYCGTVRVGLPCGWAIQTLHDDLFNAFRDSSPNMRIRVLILTFTELYSLLASGETDLVMTLQPMLPMDQHISVRGIGTVNHAAAISNHHPLADKPDLSIRDLIDEPLYLTPDDEANWTYWRSNLMRCYGFDPVLTAVVNYQTQLTYVHGGEGAALIDMFCQMETRPDFRLIPLDFTENVVLAHKTENVSTEMHMVEDWLADYFQTHNGLCGDD